MTTLPDVTSDLGAYFAAIYLFGEVALNMMSSALLEAFDLHWISIFAAYFVIALISVFGMIVVHDYPAADLGSDRSAAQNSPSKATAAWRLLTADPKMICLLPFNFAFGFAASFRASFVSGEVVRIVLDDSRSKYVGLFIIRDCDCCVNIQYRIKLEKE